MVKKKVIDNNTAQLKIPKQQSPNKILVENFVSLQRVMTNLSIKFDNLAEQISKLLQLFEISAKALAEKEFSLEKGDKSSKKVLEKIDTLLEQNKIIARGLTLMHEKNAETPSPIQRFRPQIQKPGYHEPDLNEFQKSISSEEK
mgnify:CR=1 FL=1